MLEYEVFQFTCTCGVVLETNEFRRVICKCGKHYEIIFMESRGLVHGRKRKAF